MVVQHVKKHNKKVHVFNGIMFNLQLMFLPKKNQILFCLEFHDGITSSRCLFWAVWHRLTMVNYGLWIVNP
jgi:hypothetical protein